MQTIEDGAMLTVVSGGEFVGVGAQLFGRLKNRMDNLLCKPERLILL
jgi:hypothetical protein